MGQWVSSNHNAVDEYLGSCLPFAAGNITAANGVASVVYFPYITRWIQIFNNDAVGTNGLRVGFTENGVNSIGTPAENNYFVIPAGGSSARLEIKCTEIWLAGNGGDVATCSVVAGYTGIPKNNFVGILSSSAGFSGVG